MCDASDYAMGAILGQRTEKIFKVIYCASKTDEFKTYLCFEFISHAIYRILYPDSCKLITFPLNLVL